MDESDNIYYLENVEQLRAIADELRQRIMQALGELPMTVTQLGERLGLAPGKIHYHVRELERVGLVKLVKTREKGGILEKYYSPIADYISVPPSLVERLSPDETMSTFGVVLEEITQGFMRNAARVTEGEAQHRHLGLFRNYLWLRDEEVPAVMDAIEEALRPYQQPRGIDGEREWTFAQLAYDSRTAAQDETDEVPSGRRGKSLKRRPTIGAGSLSWSRRSLEEHLRKGEGLDITFLGLITFADDVPSELVDRVVLAFRHKGSLKASPEVRAVLQRKASSGSSEA